MKLHDKILKPRKIKKIFTKINLDFSLVKIILKLAYFEDNKDMRKTADIKEVGKYLDRLKDEHFFFAVFLIARTPLKKLHNFMSRRNRFYTKCQQVLKKYKG